jgi:hypothetical protein
VLTITPWKLHGINTKSFSFYKKINGSNQILYKFLHFEVAQSSMDIMAASVSILGGQSNLKMQKIVQT